MRLSREDLFWLALWCAAAVICLLFGRSLLGARR